MHTSIPRQYLATTLGLVVVLVLLSGVPGGTAPASAVWFALIPLAFLAAVHVLLGLRALAEAAAAARLGFHVRSVQAGLLRVDRGGRVRVTARDDGPGVLPGDTAGLRRRAALVLGVGLLAALAVAGATVLAALAASGGQASAGAPAAALLTGLAVATVAALVLELLPAWTGERPTTGAMLAAWRGRPAVARRRTALDVVGPMAAAGRRPATWPQGWVPFLAGPPDGSPADALGCWYGYLWATDLRAAGLARGAIEHLIDITTEPGPVRSRLLAEGAFHTARVWGDVAGAEKLLAEIPDTPATAADRLRVTAAVLWALGDDAGAAGRCREWLALPHPAGPLPGGGELITEAVEELLAEADRRADPSSAAG
jgi:hypothetical protein